MVDSEVLSEPSTGYFIYSNLIEDTSHKISLFYENGTVIYTDTKTDKSPLTSILNFAWERIWLIVGIILILLSIVSSGWLALIASVIFLTNFGVYLADDDPMSAIICVSLGIVAILVSKFQVVRE
jgi:membrane-bound ClpP family serine protease